ncbi:MAG TPA: phospho-sugar mutase, partial [Mycobacterium sp.]|nr:phospho-sugar mutase [Mycobacterium sp.]
ALDVLARRHGVHVGAAVTRRVTGIAEAAAVMARLRADPPTRLAGFFVTVTDLVQRHDNWHTDALIFVGGDTDTLVRVVVRPSGTEPKLKCYIEVRCAVVGDLGPARTQATRLRDEVVEQVGGW